MNDKTSTAHELFAVGAFDELEESTPRVYLKALADAFGPDVRIGDLLLAATEAELNDRWAETHVLDEVACSVAQELAAAEGLEPRSKEWAERIVELTLGRFHAAREARKAETQSVA